MKRFLTETQLHLLLSKQGHTFWPEESAKVQVDVWPCSETIVTLGLDCDGTLMPLYRQRYYACMRNQEEEPLCMHDVAFRLKGPFATVAGRQVSSNYFVMGPVRWLLARIKRFGRVLLWPKGGFRGDDGLHFLCTMTDGERTDEAPYLARWLERHAPDPRRVGAAVLDLSDVSDCQVLWEAANLVGASSYDFFVSDAMAGETYLLHHHDKLVISIPDARARRELLEDLAGHADLFADCSGYTSDADEEFGW